MSLHGHNETAVRLAALAGDAQVALDRVARGEGDAVDGWLAYGAALNEGRALFAGDREFGQWIGENVLGQLAQAQVEPKEQQAAMWAAANADQLAEARAASKARTVRGWHDQWKKIEAAREEETRREEAAARAEEKKREAADAAKAEAEASAEAASAPTPEARAEAETRAVEAAVVKEAAEVEAQEAAAIAAPDPHAAERKALAKLTREALEDDVIGLRAQLAEEREKRAKAEAENRRLKDEVRDLSADDKNEVIRRLQREAQHNASERWRQQEETRRAMAQAHKLRKRVAELEKLGIEL